MYIYIYIHIASQSLKYESPVQNDIFFLSSIFQGAARQKSSDFHCHSWVPNAGLHLLHTCHNSSQVNHSQNPSSAICNCICICVYPGFDCGSVAQVAFLRRLFGANRSGRVCGGGASASAAVFILAFFLAAASQITSATAATVPH